MRKNEDWLVGGMAFTGTRSFWLQGPIQSLAPSPLVGDPLNLWHPRLPPGTDKSCYFSISVPLHMLFPLPEILFPVPASDSYPIFSNKTPLCVTQPCRLAPYPGFHSFSALSLWWHLLLVATLAFILYTLYPCACCGILEGQGSVLLCFDS